MPRASALLAALAAVLMPVGAIAEVSPFDRAVQDSRDPKSSYVIESIGEIQDPDGEQRQVAIVEWRQGPLVRIESADLRVIADCEKRTAFAVRDGPQRADAALWRTVCGITPALTGAPDIAVEGGVTPVADGARLVVVPDRGFDRRILLDREHLVTAVSYRPYNVGSGIEGWIVATRIGRCRLPRALFSRESLAEPASFRCEPAETEVPSRLVTAEGVPVDHWRDNEAIRAIWDAGVDPADIDARTAAFLKAVEQSWGTESIAYAETLMWWAVELVGAGRYEESLEALDRLIGIYGRMLHEDHPLLTIAEHSKLDLLEVTLGDLADGDRVTHMRSLLDRRLRSLGADNVVTIATLKNVLSGAIDAAVLSPASADWESHLAALGQSYRRLKLIQGPAVGGLDLANVRMLLVDMLADSGRYDDALALLDEADSDPVVDPLIALFGPVLGVDTESKRLAILERAGRAEEAKALRARMADTERQIEQLLNEGAPNPL